MSFFKKKFVKWAAGVVVTSALIYIGVPAPTATQVGNVAGDQAATLVD